MNAVDTIEWQVKDKSIIFPAHEMPMEQVQLVRAMHQNL